MRTNATRYVEPILRALAGGPLTRRQLLDAVVGNPDSIDRQVSRMVQAGTICRTGKRGGYLFSLERPAEYHPPRFPSVWHYAQGVAV